MADSELRGASPDGVILYMSSLMVIVMGLISQVTSHVPPHVNPAPLGGRLRYYYYY